MYDIVSAPTTKFLGNSVDIYPVGPSPVLIHTCPCRALQPENVARAHGAGLVLQRCHHPRNLPALMLDSLCKFVGSNLHNLNQQESCSMEHPHMHLGRCAFS